MVVKNEDNLFHVGLKHKISPVGYLLLFLVYIRLRHCQICHCQRYLLMAKFRPTLIARTALAFL